MASLEVKFEKVRGILVFVNVLFCLKLIKPQQFVNNWKLPFVDRTFLLVRNYFFQMFDFKDVKMKLRMVTKKNVVDSAIKFSTKTS